MRRRERLSFGSHLPTPTNPAFNWQSKVRLCPTPPPCLSISSRKRRKHPQASFPTSYASPSYRTTWNPLPKCSTKLLPKRIFDDSSFSWTASSTLSSNGTNRSTSFTKGWPRLPSEALEGSKPFSPRFGQSPETTKLMKAQDFPPLPCSVEDQPSNGKTSTCWAIFLRRGTDLPSAKQP